MPDPILVEERFQILVEELEPAESIRQRISLIREFLLFLEGNYSKFDSYVVEIIHSWPLYSGPITYSGINPSEILDDLRLFAEIGSQSGTVAQQEIFSDITVRLREVATVLFLCLGNVQSAYSMIGHSAGKERGNPAEAKKDSHAVSDTDTKHREAFEEFRRALVSGRSQGPTDNLVVNIGRIVKDLNYICDKKNQNDILVPVVESFDTVGGERKIYGRLRRLKVRVNSKNDLQNDRIVRRYSVVGVEKPGWLEDSKVSLSARELLDKFSPGTEISHYNGEMFYEYSRAMHQGHSSNAATAVLWFTGLQKKEGLRERYQLNNNIALTGDVDEEGHLLPVSENSIKAKVHASFFSWASALIVPLSQADEFREELRTLQETYPNKELTFMSPNSLDELFFDRRISTHLNPSKIRHAASRMWGKKFEIASLVLIALLSLIIFRLVYGPLDKKPVMGDYSGESLFIKNRAGNVIETISVDRVTVNRASSPYFDYALEFADILENGTSEVIWGDIVGNDQGERKGHLYAKTLGSSDLIWKKELAYDLKFVQKPYVVGNNYMAQKVQAHDFDNDDQLELLKHSNHITYFPGIISLLNPENGHEISQFVNSGHIRDLIIYDIDQDGVDEILFCGINNAFDMAFIAMIEVDRMNGYSPHTIEYEIEEYDVLRDMTYVLIPKTIVGLNSESIRPYNTARGISILEDEKLIRLEVTDYQLNDSQENSLLYRSSYLNFYLNFDFSLVSVGTTDGYDVIANRLLNEGTINFLPDEDYFRRYARELKYWNGKDFDTYEEFFSKD